ncbi:hypothetical protein U9M73_15560 [Paenibacillus phoenicis]|uniref:Glycosyltransferase 2-like domain-containing protein n=1 Tax=Paenibacillus phoenicis TaxID=554117 RepID=A0ABU5PNB1_9BACL|nr:MULTISPECIES: hypothetical protein [Paenibacillus]MCT2197458.1 hypothetical protein [Paenibacillus sp. p3-SID1389]MEA3571371.1 hypothetical protein [Paenibacillus phoenicis]
MVSYIGWILLSYGLAAALVHVLHGMVRQGKRKDRAIHYILVTSNHENQMEWYLRALSWYARLRGLSLQVTVLDESSQDDTLAILRKLEKQGGIELTVIGLAVVQQEDVEAHAAMVAEDAPVCIDLRVPREADKIPYVHV